MVSQQFTVFTIPTAVIFFATIALAVGLADGDAGSTVRRLPLALPLLYFAVRIAFADHALALAQRDLAAGNLTAAAAHYAASGQTSDLWYSRALLAAARKAPDIAVRLQAFQMASPAGERATRTAEDPFNAWYSLSSIRAAQNDVAGAERCLRAAIAAHPTWFKPHWMLAQVLRLQVAPAKRRARSRTGRRLGWRKTSRSDANVTGAARRGSRSKFCQESLMTAAPCHLESEPRGNP